MPAFFITATGTDIGKTYIAAALIRHWRSKGRKVSAIKPVMSGYDEAEPAGSDAGVLLRALCRPANAEDIAAVSPWRYSAPLSPDAAAAREGKRLDLDAVIAFCREQIAQAEDILLIEGVGGVMAPLNDERTMLDWLVALNIPVAVVTATYLGAISHTLTALQVLEMSGLDVRALVVNETPRSGVPVSTTLASLERMSKGIELITVLRGDTGTGIAALADLLEG